MSSNLEIRVTKLSRTFCKRMASSTAFFPAIKATYMVKVLSAKQPVPPIDVARTPAILATQPHPCFLLFALPPHFATLREYNNLTKRMDDEDLAPTHKGVPFKLEGWSDDEHALAEEDMGDIALVVGINNQTLVSVSDVQSWQAAVGGSSATKKGRGTNSGQQTLSLYASDSEDETAAYNERLKKALARRPPPPPQAHHPPAPSLPSQVEVLSRHPPLPPPHSHPSILAWRVPPPSLHIQCSPPSHPHPHPLPHPHPRPRPLPCPLSQPPKESGLKRKRDEGTVDDEKGTDGLATRKKHDARGR
ncbi:hypothetical protein DFH05DRAFT_1525499 [Lentinula detonsa]|uniref:Uncharacterized protein n=1 Tax=Lentinula detonsa TaxID=2804962 RepID=A0A9W8P0I9_9AGAR|nr:hypothetical protein DFH05DRAFT_1525499 [Lentinula detonsa]